MVPLVIFSVRMTTDGHLSSGDRTEPSTWNSLSSPPHSHRHPPPPPKKWHADTGVVADRPWQWPLSAPLALSEWLAQVIIRWSSWLLAGRRGRSKKGGGKGAAVLRERRRYTSSSSVAQGEMAALKATWGTQLVSFSAVHLEIYWPLWGK